MARQPHRRSRRGRGGRREATCGDISRCCCFSRALAMMRATTPLLGRGRPRGAGGGSATVLLRACGSFGRGRRGRRARATVRVMTSDAGIYAAAAARYDNGRFDPPAALFFFVCVVMSMCVRSCDGKWVDLASGSVRWRAVFERGVGTYTPRRGFVSFERGNLCYRSVL